MSYKLSILAQSPFLPGTNAVEAFKQTVYLAQKQKIRKQESLQIGDGDWKKSIHLIKGVVK